MAAAWARYKTRISCAKAILSKFLFRVNETILRVGVTSLGGPRPGTRPGHRRGPARRGPHWQPPAATETSDLSTRLRLGVLRVAGPAAGSSYHWQIGDSG